MIKNEISFVEQNNLPQAIAELEFTRQADAEVFIHTSKEFIKKYWYNFQTIKWLWIYNTHKKEYLLQVQDLILYSEEKNGIDYRKIKMLAKLSNAIDDLACWNTLPYWTTKSSTNKYQSQDVSWWEYSPHVWYTGAAGPLQIQ